MIERYKTKEMSLLWSEENKFTTWFDVEIAVLETLVEQGILQKKDVSEIKKSAQINVKRILEIEEEVQHDVIAFCTSIAEQCGAAGRVFHYGLTSSDVVDTALGVMLVRASDIIIGELTNLMDEVKKQALQYKELICIGRTHGMHAEPTVFGLKFLGFYAELLRHRKNLKRVKTQISRGKLSGAVGVYGALSPEVERSALAKLGLKPEPVSTQIIPRDRHARFVTALAELGGSLEKFAVELRHLQRSEVDEVEEAFSVKQKGSSAMPHKKNPISCENITGCARVLRGYALTALENVALWHERDISHSSAERIIFPDATTLSHYILVRMTKVVAGLNVKPENIAKNLAKSQGVFFSGHVLLALVDNGMAREDAYRIVQSSAHKALADGLPLQTVLQNDPLIREKIAQSSLDQIFELKRFTQHVDKIYERVLGNDHKISKR